MLSFLDGQDERRSRVVGQASRQLHRGARVVDEHREDLVPPLTSPCAVTISRCGTGWRRLRARLQDSRRFRRVRPSGEARLLSSTVRAESARMLPGSRA